MCPIRPHDPTSTDLCTSAAPAMPTLVDIIVWIAPIDNSIVLSRDQFMGAMHLCRVSASLIWWLELGMPSHTTA